MVEALTWSAAVFTAGGLLLLERRCLGQIAVVQPLVLCLICGWITDTPEIAVWLGITLQLLSVGQGHNADWALAGVICAAGILLQDKLEIPLVAGSPHSIVLITAAVLFAMAARRFDKYLARTDCAKQRAAPAWEKPDLPKAFERLIHGRVRRGFLVGGVQSLVGVGASMFLVIGIHSAPVNFSPLFADIAALGVPALGGAITLGSLSGYRFVGYAAAGMAAALTAMVLS